MLKRFESLTVAFWRIIGKKNCRDERLGNSVFGAVFAVLLRDI